MGLTQVGTGGIKDNAVTSGKILDSEIETSDIKDEAVTLAKLPKGDNDSDGKVLTSNNDAAPTFNTPTVEGVDVKSDGITATSPYKFLRADGDNTCSWQVPAGTSVVSTGTNGDGLAPARPDNNQSDVFLRGDATWAVPSYATLVTDQTNGLAPSLPGSNENPTLKFLRGDRSWQELNYTVSGTTTGDAGTDASVSLSGTAFSFTIPKGDQGIPGAAATIGIDSTVTGAAGTSASVTNEGTSSAASFKFTIPRGDQGTTGASGKTILNGSGAPTGSTGGNVGDFYIDTTNNNIYGPKESGGWVGSATSLVGPAGDAATIAVGTVTTGAEGSSATVTNSGSTSAATFDFSIPKGDKGDEGDAATISVGTVTTGAAGSAVSVTNSGSTSAATFDFSIPQGAAGSDATVNATNVDNAGAIMNSDLDGKGEILVGDGSGDPTALAVGSDNHMLIADSSEATGLRWTKKDFFSITNTGTVAGTWLGSHDDISSYFDGMTIAFYQNNIAGASTTTLNINSLGAKTIYYAGKDNTDYKLTQTHYGPRTLIMLQYDSEKDAFYAHDFFYTDTYRLRWQTDMQVGDISVSDSTDRIDGYQLLMEGIDGKMYPVTVCKSGYSSTYHTRTDNPVQTAELRVGGLMLLYESSGNKAANLILNSNALYTSIESSNMEYWNNRASTTWATEKRPWYIVATMNANGNFVLNAVDESNNASTTAFLTQDLPDSDDGKFYIMGGWMEDTSDEYRLQVDHPIYVYKDGKVRTYTGYASDADKLDGLEATSFLRSDQNDTISGNLTATGTIYGRNASIGNNLSSGETSVTIGAGADGNINSYLDIVGDAHYSDYGLRAIRFNGGKDTDSEIAHRGVGTLRFTAKDAGDILFQTTNTARIRITSAGHLIPETNNSYTLGTSSQKWSDIHTNDLHLSNEGGSGNDIDGTTGSWKIQEGSDDLFLVNTSNGKKYKFNITEIS